MKKTENNLQTDMTLNQLQEPFREHTTDEQEDANDFVTHAKVEEMIQNALSSLRIYVLESDITQAQNNVKAIVEHSTF